MIKSVLAVLIATMLFQSAYSQQAADSIHPSEIVSKELTNNQPYSDSRPWTRWWWFATEIDKASIEDNLSWLKSNGFGGVEIAWVYPLNRMKKDTVNYTPRQEWLSPEWTDMVTYAKSCADSLGLGCDFTFGSLWPFGDTKVPFNEATMNLLDPAWRQEISASWEYPRKGYVLDHLSRKAFNNYAERTGNALKPAMKGSTSALFCDSWEVETKFLSTPGFTDDFIRRYGYPLTGITDSLYSKSEPYASVRYDYMKLISERVINEFYRPFTQKSHALGGISRVQCSGAPCDIISAYAAVDVPESEALLYDPTYSNIVASAAALSGKKTVTCETFTCLYGWPRDHHSEEQVADLKLLADAVFANGVNQVFWHGKPYNPAGCDTVKFYASVHVGKSGALAEDIPAFNNYLQKVSSFMKKGTNVADVAVYLPLEDSWKAGELPAEKQFIWAWGEYEQRYTVFPEELKAYRPMWINQEFLLKAKVENKRLLVGDLSFSALYLDVKYLDIVSLRRIVELAVEGLQVCLKQIPAEPGFIKATREYNALVKNLSGFENIKSSWDKMENMHPFVTGTSSFDYWYRTDNGELYIFFANPKSKNLKFPLQYGQSLDTTTVTNLVNISFQGKEIPVELKFTPYQSLLKKINSRGEVADIDIEYLPKTPVYKPRIKNGKEKWEIQSPAK